MCYDNFIGSYIVSPAQLLIITKLKSFMVLIWNLDMNIVLDKTLYEVVVDGRGFCTTKFFRCKAQIAENWSIRRQSD